MALINTPIKPSGSRLRAFATVAGLGDAGGTPAFFVNGTQVITPGGEGASLEDLSRAIDAELAK